MLKEELDRLAGSIEIKSDQLYALYDVLEGQRAAGQEMAGGENIEQEVDEDLPWEGIDDE